MKLKTIIPAFVIYLVFIYGIGKFIEEGKSIDKEQLRGQDKVITTGERK